MNDIKQVKKGTLCNFVFIDDDKVESPTKNHDWWPVFTVEDPVVYTYLENNKIILFLEKPRIIKPKPLDYDLYKANCMIDNKVGDIKFTLENFKLFKILY